MKIKVITLQAQGSKDESNYFIAEEVSSDVDNRLASHFDALHNGITEKAQIKNYVPDQRIVPPSNQLK